MRDLGDLLMTRSEEDEYVLCFFLRKIASNALVQGPDLATAQTKFVEFGIQHYDPVCDGSRSDFAKLLAKVFDEELQP